ncbi:hypothetical protein [Rhodococcus sp. JS3073]|uniref:hypothetical protein n=1 Tax=Rhodococcus sp. JS3073 TaxID=3002901 RepID=UPI002285E997|nr:hypothetical protein [Rhodococcus sp. JS3073]WAM19618.1 hypothetical protein OYT95_38825 [Rhodococcus sp. JS3073]
MFKFVAFDQAGYVREDAHGFDSHVFFGDRKAEGPGPQIYINAVDPGVKLAAHFHRIDQFQVFFGTEGAVFQRKPIPSVFVHYTDAYSSYGPFSAAQDAPLLYATIRAKSSNYGGVMPGARTERPHVGRRQLSKSVDGWQPSDLPGTGTSETVEIFPRDQDGLAATLVRLGAGATYDTPSTSATAGRAWCVLAGDILTSDQSKGPRSIGWQDHSDDDDVATLTAGADGASLLALDFPWPATDTVTVDPT